MQSTKKKTMGNDLLQSISQGSYGAQDTENSRIAAIADELERLCKVHGAHSRDCEEHVTPFELEQRLAERMAKENGFWIPISDIFKIGVPGPSGNENDTYVADKAIYKVNNLHNTGSIIGLLRKVFMHNQIFPDTAYKFYALTGMDGRMVMPVIIQPRIANAHPATKIMIDTYMNALGFEKGNEEGRFSNDTYEVWDVLPRNVLVDDEGDIFVVDAEIKSLLSC